MPIIISKSSNVIWFFKFRKWKLFKSFPSVFFAICNLLHFFNHLLAIFFKISFSPFQLLLLKIPLSENSVLFAMKTIVGALCTNGPHLATGHSCLFFWTLMYAKCYCSFFIYWILNQMYQSKTRTVWSSFISFINNLHVTWIRFVSFGTHHVDGNSGAFL